MTQQEILHLASLSKLEFNEEQLKKFENEFDFILNFVAQIKNANEENEVKLKKVKLCELREDVVHASLPQSEVLKNAPKADEGSFIVPLVVE